MQIRSIKPYSVGAMRDIVRRELRDSRFTFDSEIIDSYVKLRNIRLKEKKLYCGNHPNACENPFGKPRQGVYLEGADWVEFNDRLNDACDKFDVHANIRSSILIVRKGFNRRTCYGSHVFSRGLIMGNTIWEWNKDEDDDFYENYCGKVAPNSSYPFGTPGIYSREVA
jgi:hypothetical protein